MSNEAGLALLGLGLVLFVVMVIGLLLAPAPSRATPESSLKLEPSPAPEEVDEPDVFEELERLGHAAQIRAAEEAKVRPWLRPIGFFSRLMTYAVLFLLLYIWAPKDISKTPLATLTLSDIMGTVAFVAFGILLVRALFNPSEDDQIKDAWGWLGVVILGGVAIGAVYFYNAR